MSTLKKLLVGAVAGAAALAMAAQSSATALLVGTGWQYDQVNSTTTPSENSPLTFTVPTGATYVFSLSDGFIPGDIYTVTASGMTVFSTFTLYPTTFNNNLGPAAGDFAADWLDASFSHLQLMFAPGTYSLSIGGNCGGGCPAGVGERLDNAIPEPAAWLAMVLGFGGIGVAMRRRRKLALTAA
ncbi:MAG TPA: PEP-CTERM sorting domain-containing protein [Caulobacteraceae bacterium]|jgi:hypothetical protein|nr:PEP-CTERM sorting domain-containing protein [Caulobacteraceae bacterium]